MALSDLGEWILRIIDAADRERGRGPIARVEVLDWAEAQCLELSSVGEALADLDRAGLIALSGGKEGVEAEGAPFAYLTDAGREWLLRHGGAAGPVGAPNEEMFSADEERGEWGYRVTVPPAGRPWNVLIRRRLFHPTKNQQAVGGHELPYVTTYLWRCWRCMYDGQVTIDTGRYPSTREEALAAAKSYILEYEEKLAGGGGEG